MKNYFRAAMFIAFAAVRIGWTDYIVTTNGAGGSYTNIQEAIEDAPPGATVWVSNGVYVVTNVVRSNATVVVEKSITLRSFNGPEVTIMDAAAEAGDERIVLYVRNAGAVVDGFTIRGGHLTNSATPGGWLSGGGVQLFMSGLVRNCHIVSNTGHTAGGVHIRSSARMEDCFIYDNVSTATGISGGGVRMSANGGVLHNCVVSNNFSPGDGGGIVAANNVTISFCTVTDNHAYGNGGGIFTTGGPVITDSPLIANNQANGWGGGVYLRNAEIFNSTLTGNHALVGGGIATHVTAGTIISNCHVIGNVSTSTTSYGGGGIFLQAGDLFNIHVVSNISYNTGGGIRMDNRPSISRNCLVANNIASKQGGGIYFGSSATSLVENCTVAGNMADDGGGVFFMTQLSRLTMIDNSIVYHNTASSSNDDANNDSNVYMSNTCVSVAANWPDAGNISDPPIFENITADNYWLSRDSPCRSAGQNKDWMTDGIDLDGGVRLDKFTRRVDMGCYEYRPTGTMFQFR